MKKQLLLNEILNKVEMLENFDTWGYKQALNTYYMCNQETFVQKLINEHFSNKEISIIKDFCMNDNKYLTEQIVEKIILVIENTLLDYEIILYSMCKSPNDTVIKLT